MLGNKDRQLVRPMLLGQGTFSKVYRVTDVYTGKLLACKVSGNKKMMKWEAYLLENVKHPAFPRYYDCFEKQGNFCILMEYICGSNLKNYVNKRGKIKEKQAIRIVTEIAEALKFLHEQPLPMVYRDLKPENIMIQADGHVRLVDLGCVCYLAEGADELSLRKGRYTVTHAGTLGYAAPEQFGENCNVGRESDVYALGKILEYMLIGRGERRSDGVIAKVSTNRISSRTRKIIKWATNVEQQERMPDMRMLLDLLQKKKVVKAHFYYEKDVLKI